MRTDMETLATERAVPTTRQRQSNARRDKILENALQLFCEKGIEDTAVEDVAKASGVGAATIYRYFDTKAELAIQSAMVYWSKVAQKYLPVLQQESYRQLNGCGQLEQILQIFNRIFQEEYTFLRFLQEFDLMLQKSKLPWERLQAYEEGILDLQSYVIDALEKGEADGTLYFAASAEEIYFTVTHTLLSLMQKMACGGSLLASDEKVDPARQVALAGQLLLMGLKA